MQALHNKELFSVMDACPSDKRKLGKEYYTCGDMVAARYYSGEDMEPVIYIGMVIKCVTLFGEGTAADIGFSCTASSPTCAECTNPNAQLMCNWFQAVLDDATGHVRRSSDLATCTSSDGVRSVERGGLTCH